MPRRRYTSDLTDAEWSIAEKCLQELRATNRGRPATLTKREILNASWTHATFEEFREELLMFFIRLRQCSLGKA